MNFIRDQRSEMFFYCKDEDEIDTLFKKLCYHLCIEKTQDQELLNILNDSYNRAMDLQKKKRFLKDLRNKEISCKIHENDPLIDIIDLIFNFSESVCPINLKFPNSVRSQLESMKYITNKQYNVLVKIFYEEKINEHYKKDFAWMYEEEVIKRTEVEKKQSQDFTFSRKGFMFFDEE